MQRAQTVTQPHTRTQRGFFKLVCLYNYTSKVLLGWHSLWLPQGDFGKLASTASICDHLQLLEPQEIRETRGKCPVCASIAPGFLCLKPGSNPGAFLVDSISSEKEQCFSNFHVLQAGTFLVPTRVGEVQHTSVTCSGRHLNTWRTSLLTLKPLAGRWESPSQEQKREENGSSWPSGRSRWCLFPKHPILLGDHLCYCWHTARSRTSCCFPDETQISLASFPEPLHWLQRGPLLMGQKVPHSPSLTALHERLAYAHIWQKLIFLSWGKVGDKAAHTQGTFSTH